MKEATSAQLRLCAFTRFRAAIAKGGINQAIREIKDLDRELGAILHESLAIPRRTPLSLDDAMATVDLALHRRSEQRKARA